MLAVYIAVGPTGGAPYGSAPGRTPHGGADHYAQQGANGARLYVFFSRGFPSAFRGYKHTVNSRHKGQRPVRSAATAQVGCSPVRSAVTGFNGAGLHFWHAMATMYAYAEETWTVGYSIYEVSCVGLGYVLWTAPWAYCITWITHEWHPVGNETIRDG